MLNKIPAIYHAFLLEDSRLASVPETEQSGHPFTVCTNIALWLKDNFFPNAAIYGYHTEDFTGGHDFLVIEERYILDFWERAVNANKKAPVFLDMHQHSEQVKKHYGNPKFWEKIK